MIIKPAMAVADKHNIGDCGIIYNRKVNNPQ